MSDFQVIIPARFKSVRLPGKVLMDLGGKPMIQHVHERAVASGASAVWIATDSEQVAEVARGFGARVLMTGDHPSGTDRLAEAVALLNLPDHAVVVNLQGDEPQMPSRAIEMAARTLEDHSQASVATLAVPISDPELFFSPDVVKVVLDGMGYALYFSRAPIPYDRDAYRQGDRSTIASTAPALRHIGLYAYRAGFLHQFCDASPADIEKAEKLEQLRVLHAGARIAVATWNGDIPAGVDTGDDAARVDAAFRSRASNRVSALFVCMGNICRSPTGQAIAEKLISERGLDFIDVDSAGTHAYHVGEPPDPRSQEAGKRRGLDMSKQRARPVDRQDFDRFDYILAMDERNFQALLSRKPRGSRAEVVKIMSFCDRAIAADVPDPYQGGRHGFEQVLDLLENAVGGFVDHVSARVDHRS